MSQQLKFSFNHFKCVSKISVLTKKSNASTSGFEQSSSQKWLEFQTNDYGRRAAIPLETTLHAFRNQEKTKQRSTVVYKKLSFLFFLEYQTNVIICKLLTLVQQGKYFG